MFKSKPSVQSSAPRTPIAEVVEHLPAGGGSGVAAEKSFSAVSGYAKQTQQITQDVHERTAALRLRIQHVLEEQAAIGAEADVIDSLVDAANAFSEIIGCVPLAYPDYDTVGNDDADAENAESQNDEINDSADMIKTAAGGPAQQTSGTATGYPYTIDQLREVWERGSALPLITMAGDPGVFHFPKPPYLTSIGGIQDLANPSLTLAGLPITVTGVFYK